MSKGKTIYQCCNRNCGNVAPDGDSICGKINNLWLSKNKNTEHNMCYNVIAKQILGLNWEDHEEMRKRYSCENMCNKITMKEALKNKEFAELYIQVKLDML